MIGFTSVVQNAYDEAAEIAKNASRDIVIICYQQWERR
jgi:hypothetical protein